MGDPANPPDELESAVHMILLRGPADSSRVLYWDNGYNARLMMDPLTGANSRHINVPNGDPDNPPYDEIFCAGHSALPDGKLLVVGGTFTTHAPSTGAIKSALTFDPLNYGLSANWGWSAQDDMPFDRWYPTSTTLGDGRVLVTSGVQYYPMVMFGGTDGLNVRSEIHPLAVTSQEPFWDTWNNFSPPIRTGHTAAFLYQDKLEYMIVFGGRDQMGPRNETYAGIRNEGDTSLSWTWCQITTGSPAWCQLANATLPPARSDHAMVSNVVRVGNPTGTRDTFYVFGGRGVGGGPLEDVWRFFLDASSGKFKWELIGGGEIPGIPPGPRYAHSAVYDPGPPAAPYRSPRLLVFGGRTVGDGLADNKVYALSLSGPLQWSVVADEPGAPPARAGQTLTIEEIPRNGVRRVFLVGGEDGPGTPLADAWLLSRPESGNNYSWSALPSGPPARTEHAAYHDRNRDQLLVVGGRLAGGPASDLWGLQLATSTPTWVEVSAGAPPSGRYGHTVVFTPQEHKVVNRVPDRFDPTQSPGQLPQQQWERLPVSASKLQKLTYPFMFVLPNSDGNPNGKVFWAGPNNVQGQTFVLDLGLPVPNWGPPIATGNYWGASAVMYEPGKVMKCGGYENSGEDATKTMTIQFNLDGTHTGWQLQTISPLASGRTNQNLTVLPTGEVLITGGWRQGPGYSGMGTSAPAQLWDAFNKTWGAELAMEPASRNYHSTALLLPDGRVLSAGGDPPDIDAQARKGTIYEPPYLFNADNSLAQRPIISAVSPIVNYTDSVSLCTPQAATITSVCLIKPGAPTHAFNQDQRYVPLGFSYCGTGEMLRVAPPPNGTWAPPGDYMLFIVQTIAGRKVPAVAKWVRVGAQSMGSQAVCTGCWPGGGGCPFVDNRTDRGWQVENSILGRSLTGAMGTDVYRLKASPAVEGGRVSLRVRENEQEYTMLDRVVMVAVDHEDETQAVAAGDRIILGSVVPAHLVITASGQDITALATSIDPTACYTAASGETLTVEFVAPDALGVLGPGAITSHSAYHIGDLEKGDGGIPREGPQTAGLGVETNTDGMWLSSTGYLIQTPDGRGGWRTVRHRYPREFADGFVVEGLDHGPVRLVFVGTHKLWGLGSFEASETPPTVQGLTLEGAVHSRLGDVLGAVRDEGGGATLLTPGDTLSLVFEAPDSAGTAVRDWFFVSYGVYSSAVPFGQEELGFPAPARFSLAQNHPNPFTTSTAIRFELPVATKAKIEVFDLAGRRVRVLTDRAYEPGRHMVGWDRRDGSGSLAAPGVYLYRMTAEGHGVQKRMVLLPGD